MEKQTFRDGSHKNYGTQNQLTIEQIQTGCLQRIADATEAMAKNYNELIAERDRYKKQFYDTYKQFTHMESVISGYKGVVTKLKNQIKALKDGSDNPGIAASKATE